MPTMTRTRILLVADRSVWSDLAMQYLFATTADVVVARWERGEERPRIEDWRGDWLLSFKSDLILSDIELRRAEQSAINFHPAPPHYRGIGGYCYAALSGDTHFGVTCHHMISAVDYGPIIEVAYFPIVDGESMNALKLRAATQLLVLFQNIVMTILRGGRLPTSVEQWRGPLRTRRELKQFLESNKTE